VIVAKDNLEARPPGQAPRPGPPSSLSQAPIHGTGSADHIEDKVDYITGLVLENTGMLHSALATKTAGTGTTLPRPPAPGPVSGTQAQLYPAMPIWLATEGTATQYCPNWEAALAPQVKPEVKMDPGIQFYAGGVPNADEAQQVCAQAGMELCRQDQVAGAVVLDYTSCYFGWIKDVRALPRVVMPMGVSASCTHRGVHKRSINLRPVDMVPSEGVYCCPRVTDPVFPTKCDPYRNQLSEVLATAAMMILVQIFERHGAPIWLADGHLLAVVRDKQIGHCRDSDGTATDLDLYAFLKDYCHIHSIGSPLNRALRAAGFWVGAHVTGYKDSIWVNKDNTLGLDYGHTHYSKDFSHEVHIDIGWVQQVGENYLLGHKAWAKTCVNFFDVREQIQYGVDIFKTQVQIPSRPERLLRAIYGPTWGTKSTNKAIHEREENPEGCHYYGNDI